MKLLGFLGNEIFSVVHQHTQQITVKTVDVQAD